MSPLQTKPYPYNKGHLLVLLGVVGDEDLPEGQELLPDHLLRGVSRVEPEGLEDAVGDRCGDALEEVEFLADDAEEDPMG